MHQDEFEYIRIEEVERKEKTSVFHIFNKHHGDLLGLIRWHGPWRRYVVEFDRDRIWDEGCLKEVFGFLVGLRLGRTLVKHEWATLCMGCHTISPLQEVDVMSFRQMLSSSPPVPCPKCGQTDIMLFNRGVQVKP